MYWWNGNYITYIKSILYRLLFQGSYARCDNNCAGVDPNAIIGGGVAAAGIIGISAQALAGPAAGIGLGGVAGITETRAEIDAI